MDKVSMEDNYRVFVPIEDRDLMKAVEIDENGDYIVQGVMSSDDLDEEGDNIEPTGMDCSYFLQKGWIKYEHGKEPKQFIGEPLEVKVGKFPHPTLLKSVNGVYIKGRLFHQRELAQQAVQAIEDLQKSQTKRRMGWSIEGNVKERCRKTGRVKKSILRNVVLTMNPVNTSTWAELQKSFSPDHELTIDMVDNSFDKAMNMANSMEIHRQSLEGCPHEPLLDKDEEDNAKEHGKLHKIFRKMLAKILGNKRMQKSFIASSEDDCGLMTYNFAISEGLDNVGAEKLASCVNQRKAIIKALIIIGGEKMAGKASKLMDLLDGDLEALQKAMNAASSEEEEEDMEDPEHEAGESEEEEAEERATGEEDEDQEDDEEDDEDDEEDDEDSEEDEDEEDEDSEEDEDDTQKSLFGNGKSSLRKSLESDESMEKALEVSDFLSALVDEIGFGQEGLEKSIMKVAKGQDILVKSMTNLVNVVKTQQETIDSLQKSLNDVLQRPVGRRGAVSQVEVKTLQKGLDTSNTGERKPLSRMQISDILYKSFEAGEIGGSTVSRFEAGVGLGSLNLPESVLKRLGI